MWKWRWHHNNIDDVNKDGKDIDRNELIARTNYDDNDSANASKNNNNNIDDDYKGCINIGRN